MDLFLRLLVIEKHDALKWIEAGVVDIPEFEMPGYKRREPGQEVTKEEEEAKLKEEAEKEPLPSTWSALLSMVTSWRPCTLFALTMLNGTCLQKLCTSFSSFC